MGTAWHRIARAAERRPSIARGVNLASKAVGSDPSQVLFGSRAGSHYMDNTPELFEWVLRELPELRATWMAREDVAARLRVRSLPVARLDRSAGLVMPLRARVGVAAFDLRDIAREWQLVPDSLRVLFLGHGKSVKLGGVAMKQDSRSRRWWRRQTARWPTLVGAAAATSPFIADLGSEGYNIPRERFVITGLPRDDIMLEPSPGARFRFDEVVGRTDATTVLYAPTWRQGREPTQLLPFSDRDVAKLRDFLESHGVVLLLRPHLMDLDGETGRDVLDIVDGQNIVLCSAREFESANQVLPFVDALISDYSAIYHDFLLLDRPIILVPYDADRFAEVQGFGYDYHALRPGPAVSTQAELIDLLAAVANGEDLDTARRRHLRDLVHTHRDGRARERLSEVLWALIGGADHVVGADDGSWDAVPS